MNGASNTARTIASACTPSDGFVVKGRGTAQLAAMAVAMVGNPVFQPMHEAEMLWGAEAYELWSQADLSYDHVVQLIRPRKAGQGGWGFYFTGDDGRVVSAWWALVNEDIDVVSLIARAKTYFGQCARMVEARADELASRGSTIWAYDVRSFMRRHQITLLQLNKNLQGNWGLKTMGKAIKGGESSMALRTAVSAALRRIEARRKVG
jgi:hypothetical protein